MQIYCSPLLRAIETCVLLADRLEVDYEITDALREYDCTESGNIFGEGKMRLMVASEVRTDTICHFLSSEQAGRLDDMLTSTVWPTQSAIW